MAADFTMLLQLFVSLGVAIVCYSCWYVMVVRF